MPSMYTQLAKAQLRWAGHVVRMPEGRLPKKIFYGELVAGKRSRGGQRKKASLRNLGIDPNNWESLAEGRSSWRNMTRTGAAAYEDKRQKVAIEKWQIRKSNKDSPASTGHQATHLCPHCGKYFRARIGLISHLRIHKKS